MPNPESRKLIKTSVQGVYKRGNRHVAVVRIDGKQRKIACHNLAEGRDIVALARANPKQLKKRRKAKRSGVTLREYGQRWIVSYTGRSGGASLNAQVTAIRSRNAASHSRLIAASGLELNRAEWWRTAVSAWEGRHRRPVMDQQIQGIKAAQSSVR